MYIYSYNQGSHSASNLANELDIPKIKHRNSRFIGAAGKVVINWGSSTLPEEVLKCRVLNRPEAVAVASNKLSTFQALRGDGGVLMPNWTQDKNTARQWIERDSTVVCRTILNGHSGNGIIICNKDNIEEFEAQNARLYTKYIKKHDEFRVHVAGGRVIDLQRKGLSQEFQGRDDINWKVRNLANGFVYVRADVNIPDITKEHCVRAVRALGLDFGAVDIIHNRGFNEYYVLEVNTAPGLTGQTIASYANAFRGMI